MPPAPANLRETGSDFRPAFDANGLMVCVTCDAGSGQVLMVAYMNTEALARTLSTGEMWYWSRSRARLWRKGDTSGQIQKWVELRTDCDQDALLAQVTVLGDGTACHTGRRSCFYRRLASPDTLELEFIGKPRGG